MLPEKPLLQCIVFFYGKLGIQLETIQWNNWRSVANLLWNIVFNSLIVFALLHFDIYFVEDTLTYYNEVITRKPLVGLILKADLVFIYPVTIIANQVYLNVFGHAIIALLDSSCLTQIYRKWSSRKVLFVIALVLAATNISLILFVYNYFRNHPFSLKGFFLLFYYYVVNLQLYFGFVIVLYVNYATLQLLKSISVQCCNLHELKTVANLASLNCKLNQLASFLLVTFLTCFIFDTITIICLMYFSSLFPISPFLVAYLFANSFYFMLAIVLNRQVNTMLSGFARTINKCKQIDNNLQIHHKDVEIYEYDFQLKLFHTVSLDCSFVLSIALFIANYVILILQTNTN